MRIYKTKWFHRWAVREGLTETVLHDAVRELERGMADALGGYVYKKRVAPAGRGKRGGARTLIAFRRNDKAFFMYGYPKNERANITDAELAALKRLARELLSFGESELAKAVGAGELIEVRSHGEA